MPKPAVSLGLLRRILVSAELSGICHVIETGRMFDREAEVRSVAEMVDLTLEDVNAAIRWYTRPRNRSQLAA